MLFRVSILAASTIAISALMVAPASATTSIPAHKVGICHATGSTKNPYVFIVVDEHAVAAHKNHQDGRDKIGVKSLADCPKAAVAGASTSSDQTKGTTTVPGKGSGEVLSTSTSLPTTLPTVGSPISVTVGLAAILAAAGAYAARRLKI
jgi:hypothetical protein